jgi:serine protease Do
MLNSHSARSSPQTRVVLSVVIFMTLSLFLASAARAQRNVVIELQNAFRAVARAVRPAVVNISTVKYITDRQTPPEIDPYFRNFGQIFGKDFMRQFFGDIGSNRRYRQQGIGSGFIIDPRGYILTDRHVIKGADQIIVTLGSKRKYRAKVIAADPKTDIAIIKINGRNFPYAKLGDSKTLQVGDFVLAIGNPFGLTRTVTRGIVSAKGRREMGLLDHEDFIQTDAAINPGNSGGPLVNIYGQVVGINTAILSKSGGYMGIGFAIPINLAKRTVYATLGGAVRTMSGARPSEKLAERPRYRR